MTDFFFLIPIALLMGLAGLGAFLWALKSGQYEDLDGAAVRILIEEETPSQTAGGPPRDTKPRRPGPGVRGNVSTLQARTMDRGADFR